MVGSAENEMLRKGEEGQGENEDGLQGEVCESHFDGMDSLGV